jgi:hypothetical protein
VINASPVIALTRVGQVDLLVHLPQQSMIPRSVADELPRAPEDDPAHRAIESGIFKIVATPARLFGSAEAIRTAIGAPMAPVDCPVYERDVALIRERLGQAQFAEVWAKGHSEPFLEIVSEILATSVFYRQSSF